MVPSQTTLDNYQRPLWVKGYLRTKPTSQRSGLDTKFWENISRPYKTDDHWIWIGHCHRDGPKYNRLPARRTLWEDLYGGVDGYVIVGICVEENCVNPDHACKQSRQKAAFKRKKELLTLINPLFISH